MRVLRGFRVINREDVGICTGSYRVDLGTCKGII